MNLLEKQQIMAVATGSVADFHHHYQSVGRRSM